MNPGPTPTPRYSVALPRGEADIVGAKEGPPPTAILPHCAVA
jgi:hypothetical protein